MNRRQILAAVAGIGASSLAGCAGRGSSPDGSTDSPAGPTTSDVPTRSPTPTSRARSPTSAAESEIEVPPCPGTPASLTRETVVRFASQFERAYVTRTVLREHERVTSVRVDVEDAEAEVIRTDDGWVVRFTVVGPAYRYRPTPGSTVTAHVDPPLYVASYFVGEPSVLRAVGVETVDPQTEGTAVSCPPG